MMVYYLKKLGHQELGSINATTGRPSRGRYIYISKDTSVLSFFPPLSKNVKNDSSLLPIIPLYLTNAAKVYCNFIYHNDSYHGGTRNEYRIYSNNALEGNSFLFSEDDIFIMKKQEIQIEDTTQMVYFLDLIKKSNPVYTEFNDAIINSSIRGNHAIVNNEFQWFDHKIQLTLRTSTFNTVIDQTVTKKVEESENNVEDLFSATSFRDFVMNGYNNVCAVTGDVIKYGNFFNLEAAHIRPKSHGGTFLPSNGLALSRDIHWAFDKGFFTLNDDYTILIHDEIESAYLNSYQGKSIYVSSIDFFKPNLECIRYHRENVFGLFKTSGRL